MAKSAFEKAIEKQQREAKKLADQEARRQRANAIVNGQPIVDGVRIMDPSAEEIFGIMLSLYDGNENRDISGDYQVFPTAYHSSIALEFEKLNMYGVISSSHTYLGGWSATISPQGLTYFARKENAQMSAQTKEVITKKEYDVFISHACKDKSDYVDSLYMTIRKLGVHIFYDTEILSWGDNWKQVILDGTNSSEFAIIVISENFFGREWTERELQEFLTRQNTSGQKIVLPLLHNITLERLKEEYPSLGDIQVIDSNRYSKEEIAILFAKELIKRLR
ncbi:toll/interleukin-1 receptor domain-containing protein [Intestinimonas massiliensis (ex Afouda et al. 2020)]|uniref:toll/interleukin-1 receptor domain-containing protein n=1 Tax=Intestinimonas massiliensis (ex Afouda et al. 2020) TaxID=1673721 RepID=UPI001F5F01A4|nr:toll/interleukin-1 receptor domain-containing protein [Intestinimonas massiliensis (ex Afouda et al. 2020)]